MTTYVLDTSVVLKWYNSDNEEHTDQARAILNDLKQEKITLIVPDILPLELLNVFLKGKHLSASVAQDLIHNFLSLPLISKEPTESVLSRIPKLHEQYNLTAYDSIFGALAQEEICQLISDDRKGHGKITDGTVCMLEDYQSLSH